MKGAYRSEAFLILALIFLSVFFIRAWGIGLSSIAVLGGPSSPVANGAAGTWAHGFSGPEIELNSAAPRELALLPGVGETLARRIFLKRRELGGFRSEEELEKVKGIGREKLKRLRPFVKVDGAGD